MKKNLKTIDLDLHHGWIIYKNIDTNVQYLKHFITRNYEFRNWVLPETPDERNLHHPVFEINGMGYSEI